MVPRPPSGCVACIRGSLFDSKCRLPPVTTLPVLHRCCLRSFPLPASCWYWLSVSVEGRISRSLRILLQPSSPLPPDLPPRFFAGEMILHFVLSLRFPWPFVIPLFSVVSNIYLTPWRGHERIEFTRSVITRNKCLEEREIIVHSFRSRYK